MMQNFTAISEKNKLKIWGKAQREAAQRRKFDA